jgi:FixJ family two-component response regulator
MPNKKDILIVDDDPEILAYYWKIFASGDASEFDVLGGGPTGDESELVLRQLICHRYTNAVKFLDAFEAMVRSDVHHPVCIIDMRMPVLNGFETAQRVRALDPEINIIICTAHSDMDPAEIRAKLSGSVFFVRKPFVAVELYMMVHSLIESWNAKQRLLNSAAD